MNYDFYEIIQNIAKSFKKLKTDTKALSTVKKNKIFNYYKISSDEKIIAYCKTHPLGITVNGSIFTDKAFYPRPAFLTSKLSSGELAPERIDYFELCNYIVIQTNEKSGVFLRNAQNNYFICLASLFGKNILGCEIRTVLQAIQDYLCKTDNSYDQKLNSIAADYFAAVRLEFKTGRLSADTRNTLIGMVFSKRFCIKAIYMLAEDMYRLCNKNKYISFIEQQTEYLTPNDKKRLMDVPEEFSNNFIKDLSNPNTEFSAVYTVHLLYRLKKEDETKESIKYSIFAYARVNQITKARLRLNKLIQNYGRNTAYIAEDFICLYGNKQMRDVVKLMNESSDIPRCYYSIADALGFTPLHYAILTNNEKAIKKLAISEVFYNKLPYLPNESVRNLFAYSTLSVIKDIALKNYVIAYTTPEIAQMQNDCNALKKQLEKTMDMIAAIEHESSKLGLKHNIAFIKGIITGKKVLKESDEEIFREAQSYYRESLQRLDEIRISINYRLDEIKNAVREKSSEVEEHAVEYARKYENSNNQFVKLIISLYKNNTCGIRFANTDSYTHIYDAENDSLVYLVLKILNASDKTTDFRMYHMNGYFFMLPDFILLDLPYRKVQLTADGIIDDAENCEEANIDQHTPGYGDSWFSPQAHSVNSVLKKEYRILAKLYHPDVNKNPGSAEIFLQIKTEYETLLKQFK